MAIDKTNQAAKLTNLIIEMTEGESPEILEEVVKLLNYHTGYHAGAVNGEDSFITILSKNIEELI